MGDGGDHPVTLSPGTRNFRPENKVRSTVKSYRSFFFFFENLKTCEESIMGPHHVEGGIPQSVRVS
jgi:hypothetical protein